MASKGRKNVEFIGKFVTFVLISNFYFGKLRVY